MSGLEVFAVVGAVAAMISAYKDGARIVTDIKARRARRKALPPPKLLEDSLSRGPPALEEAKNNGVERFGQAFALGDQIAVESLKDTLIALQSSLLKHLHPASNNDDVVDFTLLVDISDIGRIKAVSALYELHMRMAVAAPITQRPRIPPPDQPSGDLHPVEGDARQSQTQPFSLGRQPTASQVEALPIHMPPQDIAIGNPQRRHSTSITSPKRTSLPKFSFFNRQKSYQSSQPSSPRSSRKALPPHGPEEIIPSHGHDEEASTGTIITNPWKQRPAHKLETVGTRSSISTTNDGPFFVLPSSANDYGGFCKGAYYLQAGLSLDGVKLRNNSIAKTGESYYWGCQNKKCVFEGPAIKRRNEFFFDDTVREFRIDGILKMRYRWSFLAKSHVAIKSTKNQIYNYRCIFCILQSLPAPAIEKKRPFLEHVAMHQAQRLDEQVLLKTLCINDRIAEVDDYFDINFAPPISSQKQIQEDQERPFSERQEDSSTTVEAITPMGGLSLYEDTMLNEDPWRNS